MSLNSIVNQKTKKSLIKKDNTEHILNTTSAVKENDSNKKFNIKIKMNLKIKDVINKKSSSRLPSNVTYKLNSSQIKNKSYKTIQIENKIENIYKYIVSINNINDEKVYNNIITDINSYLLKKLKIKEEDLKIEKNKKNIIIYMNQKDSSNGMFLFIKEKYKKYEKISIEYKNNYDKNSVGKENTNITKKSFFIETNSIKANQFSSIKSYSPRISTSTLNSNRLNNSINLKKNQILHLDYSITKHDPLIINQITSEKQQEILDCIHPGFNRITVPYISNEEKFLLDKLKDKKKWVSKKGFNQFMNYKLPIIENYVNKAPSPPPCLHLFRVENKNKWIIKEGFRVA